MKKTIDQMAKLLEKNNIPIPDGARKKDGTSTLDNKEKFHSLVAGISNHSSLIIDLGSYEIIDLLFTPLDSEFYGKK